MNVKKIAGNNMKKKWMTVSSGALALIALVFLCLPFYMREALVHLLPDITDTYLFHSDTVRGADSCWQWPAAAGYNRYVPDEREQQMLEEYGTVAYLVIRDDSVVYEEYRDGWQPESLGNVFSATKSIVSLLVGIALDEGAIGSVDDPVSRYLPEFGEGGRERITVRNLLTMSSGLDWDEAYSSLTSITTKAYYGNDIRGLVMGLQPVEEPGRRYSYKSGDTQLLSFVLEAAVSAKAGRQVTVSEYAQERLWRPIQACNDALWNLDREGGDEKTYCCFNTTARDFARLGRLLLNRGEWNGRQVVSATYMDEAMAPASYLENEFGDGALDYYGFQIWTMKYRGMKLPALRGLGGQYVFVIPEKRAIVVRMGHKRSNEYRRENTVDMEQYLDLAFRILE